MSKRPKRGKEVTITSPPKPPSPEESVEEDEEYRLFWFKYVEDALHQAGRDVRLHADVNEEELGMDDKQRGRAEKKTDGIQTHVHHAGLSNHTVKRNFFVRDTMSGDILMVKLHTNVERSYKEWIINRKLKEFNVPHITPAIAWCKGRQKANGIECAFLVLPFIKSITLSQIPDSGDGALSDLQWLQGFKQMIEVFVATDPATLGANHIRLLHKDLNEGQILYEPRTSNWYLIDFGLSEITYMGPLPGEAEQVQVEVTIRASSSFSNSSEEMTTLRNIFVEHFESASLKERFMSIKTRERDTWLTAVETQIRNLSPVAPTNTTTSNTTTDHEQQ